MVSVETTSISLNSTAYISNGQVFCFLRGTDWIFKYHLHEPRLKNVTIILNMGRAKYGTRLNSIHAHDHVEIQL
jgi:hypothetical protein